jgi:aminoglycoside 6'-N-acetyltransferase
MTTKDLPMLFRWMSAPHVKSWWGTELNYEDFRINYTRNIQDPKVFPFIVKYNDLPIGYINYWFVEDDPNFLELYSHNTIGTDQLIGELEFVGKGHGSAFVKSFTNKLLLENKAPLIITDPDPANKAAIGAYLKAGFKIVKEMNTDEGVILLMEKRSTN